MLIELRSIMRYEWDFDIILCDFQSPKIQLISQLALADRAPRDDYLYRFLFLWRVQMFQKSTNNRPDPRIKTDWSTFFTFFDPNITSLHALRNGLPRERYRIAGIDQGELDRTRDAVYRGLAQRASNGSGVDWQSVVFTIIAAYAPELDRLQRVLRDAAQQDPAPASFDLDDLILQARENLLVHYTSGLLPPGAERDADTFERCQSAYIPSFALDTANEQELVIIYGIRGVLTRLCEFVLELSLFRAVAASPKFQSPAQLLSKLEALLLWLDWRWQEDCGTCAPTEQCVVPITNAQNAAIFDRPQCMQFKDWNDLFHKCYPPVNEPSRWLELHPSNCTEQIYKEPQPIDGCYSFPALL